MTIKDEIDKTDFCEVSQAIGKSSEGKEGLKGENIASTIVK